MKIIIASVGKLKQGAVHTLFADYLERLTIIGKQIGVSQIATIEVPHATKETEGQNLLAKLEKINKIYLFDESGKNLSSAEFAKMLEKLIKQGVKSCAFVIGGAAGFSPNIKARGDDIFSFGRLTLPHQLVRILAVEQLYRASTILTNHPYHK